MTLIPWFTDLKKETFPDRPWLILGKGPTFDSYKMYSEDTFNVLALNHVGYLIPSSQITLFVDFDVYLRDQIKSRFVLGPQHPHICFKASIQVLHELVKNPPSNLFQYRLSTWKCYREKLNPHPSPLIKAKYFCAEAAFQILGHFGIKQIFSLGVDGGTKYSKVFKQKPLTNGQSNFDKQFEEIENTCKRFNIEWIKL
ncbi:MAG: hypothetical protein GTO02_21510 [Candidatus Dadabacteria bacterium]|nr:hypothetical protein [Candidatus Dadabacteria bacterium]